MRKFLMYLQSLWAVTWALGLMLLGRRVLGVARWFIGQRIPASQCTAPSDSSPRVANSSPQRSSRHVRLDQVVVKHLNGGMATLLLRERARLGKCTAHLIIWAGKRRKGRQVLVEDSHYDLGYVDGVELHEAVIDGFVETAKAKLAELVVEGMKKQRRKREESPGEKLLATSETAAESGEASSSACFERNMMERGPESAIKLTRYPTVRRGRVLEMGMMSKAGKEGDIERYGVRYRTPEGLEEVVWGGDLRTAFNDSGAGVNDEVEILKIGRKTIEKGKAPMNLYKVRKLPSERIGAH